ncbi:Nramp family divalent metal transporter [Modestobacter altitudinis]|uniref:Nramp family divalent metal transporter n=1 Tax=Modestobacter altitudinis TaxID=2213158 RepID=UPI00110CE565|nr:Nramp family divalent metal transporter [Modestobacter altitudinis]
MATIDVTVPSPAALLPSPRGLRRRRTGRRATPTMLGPAFVAAIAYVDPGNFATNFSAGAAHGYLLLWVIVAANLLAMLVQTLSAKLGLATGRSMPEVCRDTFRPVVNRGLWLQAELVAIATDLAEVIGGAIALNLLFGLPLPIGGAVTGAVAFVLLALEGRGQRPFERAITGLFAVILVGFLVTLVRVPVDPLPLADGLLPGLAGTDSLVLATGILGATVMPHAIYLHSALTCRRDQAPTPGQRRQLLRAHRRGVIVAMGLAGVVNASMLVVAAGLFHGSDIPATDTLAGVHAGLARALDAPAATLFALTLLASGFASSGVGTLAGQVVMQGFVRRRMSLLGRRALTLAPALVVLTVGIDPTAALVASQVVLSFGIPFALVPLVLLTRRRCVMGDLVNRRVTTVAAAVAAAAIIGLNGFLLATLVG